MSPPRPKDAWLATVVTRHGWTQPQTRVLDGLLDEQQILWPQVERIVDQARCGGRDPAAVLPWLQVFNRYQVEALTHFAHPFDLVDREEQYHPDPRTDIHLTPPRLIPLAEATQMQARLDSGYVADIVYTWWHTLGPDAALGYAADTTIADAIKHRDNGTLDGLRLLATLRHPLLDTRFTRL